MKNLSFILVLLCGASLLFTACDPSEPVEPVKGPLETILENSDLSTFRALIEHADLTDTLNNRTALTIFAPSNAAFETYRASSGYLALADIPIPELKQLLLYHLSAGVTRPENVPGGYLASLATFDNTTNALKWQLRTVGNWMVNGVAVIHGSIPTTTGLIYPLDRVLALPKVVSALQIEPDFSSFVQALTRSDLGIDYLETLSYGPFTVFAPTNAAFTAVLSELGYANLNAVPTNTLNSIIQYHIVPNFNLQTADFTGMQQVITLGSKALSTNGPTLIDAQGRVANFVRSDIQTANGVVHGVDKVLLPN